jgi:signal transduction histidine kinase
MLNAFLNQQIAKHLGENRSLEPDLLSLFESISRYYETIEIENKNAVQKISDQEILLQECRRELKENREFFHELMQRLYQCSSILQGNSVNPEFFPKGSNKVSSLVSKIETEAFDLKQHSDLLAKKLKETEFINRELEQFAYIVSHDLKAPLRAISNLSQWIEDDVSKLASTGSKDNLSLLRSRVFRMESLINAILSYSKSTKSKENTELSDTGWLINEVIDSLNCPENIGISVKGKFPVIETQPVKLQQIFSNLISNSIKYNDKESGIIEIGFSETEEHCRFYVFDNGPGIEPQYHSKVFQIFQTLEARDIYESTGIGLAIVKKIIEDCGGKIWIESESGKWTRFIFIWPKINNAIMQKI